MENTGNGGAGVAKTASPGMAASSPRSRRSGKRSTSATVPPKQEPLDRALSLEMLASAVNEMRASGLSVVVANNGHDLVVVVASVNVKNDALVEVTRE